MAPRPEVQTFGLVVIALARESRGPGFESHQSLEQLYYLIGFTNFLLYLQTSGLKDTGTENTILLYNGGNGVAEFCFQPVYFL